MAEPAPAPFKRLRVLAPDGVPIAARTWGNPTGPEILFIPGFSQAALCWQRQVESDLAETFRLITYDLRGHGESGKPLDSAYYREARRWADEIDAVIRAAGLRRPVAVAWSYGGRILWDYLAEYGDEWLAGINFVSAITNPDSNYFGPGVASTYAMGSADLAENIAATEDFVRACTARPLPAAEFAWMLAYNMVTPPEVRQAMLGRAFPPEEALKKIRVPTLVTHGLLDRAILPEMGRYTAQVVPGARASFYEASGHMPFWEEPARYNAELREFVLGVS